MLQGYRRNRRRFDSAARECENLAGGDNNAGFREASLPRGFWEFGDLEHTIRETMSAITVRKYDERD